MGNTYFRIVISTFYYCLILKSSQFIFPINIKLSIDSTSIFYNFIMFDFYILLMSKLF